MLFSYNPKDKENRLSLIWLGVVVTFISWDMTYLPLATSLNTKTSLLPVMIDILVSLIMCFDFFFRWNNKLKLPEYTTEYYGIAQVGDQKKYKNSLWPLIDSIACIPFELIIYQLDIHAMTLPAILLRTLHISRIAKIRSAWNFSEGQHNNIQA